jgi:hypothetical protein
MQIARLPAKTGFRWVLDGFRLLRRQPVALVAIAFLNLALMGVSMIVPIIGSLGPLILTPIFMVGMMKAVRTAEAGQNPSPLTLFAGFRDDRGRAWKPLLGLGAINAVATLLALPPMYRSAILCLLSKQVVSGRQCRGRHRPSLLLATRPAPYS